MNWFFCCYDNFPVALHVSVTVLVTVTPGACPVTLAIALLPLFEAFLLLNDQLEMALLTFLMYNYTKSILLKI